MAQEYTITAFEKGDFQDNHGNYWCSMVVDGVGEPVKIVVKDPTKYEVGMKLFGDITEQTSKAGNAYLRFKRAQQGELSTSNTDSPERVESIYRCNALNNAVAYLAGFANVQEETGIAADPLEQADIFYNWLNNKETKHDNEGSNESD